MDHPIVKQGGVAVVTGAGMGIGLAACKRFAAAGMKVCLADLPSDDLDAARAAVAGLAAAEPDVIAVATDVGNAAAIDDLRHASEERLGPTTLLMNNAVTRIGGDIWGDLDDWRRAVEVNLWGVINGVRAFVPGMIARGEPAAVVNGLCYDWIRTCAATILKRHASLHKCTVPFTSCNQVRRGLL